MTVSPFDTTFRLYLVPLVLHYIVLQNVREGLVAVPSSENEHFGIMSHSSMTEARGHAHPRGDLDFLPLISLNVIDPEIRVNLCLISPTVHQECVLMHQESVVGPWGW